MIHQSKKARTATEQMNQATRNFHHGVERYVAQVKEVSKAINKLGKTLARVTKK